MVNVGDRVGAIISAKDGVVNLLGYGVLVEEKVPPADALGFGSILHEIGKSNPCLRLDDGSEVFGCECWWGSESAIKAKFANFTVNNVSIADYRSKAQNAN